MALAIFGAFADPKLAAQFGRASSGCDSAHRATLASHFIVLKDVLAIV